MATHRTDTPAPIAAASNINSCNSFFWLFQLFNQSVPFRKKKRRISLRVFAPPSPSSLQPIAVYNVNVCGPTDRPTDWAQSHHHRLFPLLTQAYLNSDSFSDYCSASISPRSQATHWLYTLSVVVLLPYNVKCSFANGTECCTVTAAVLSYFVCIDMIYTDEMQEAACHPREHLRKWPAVRPTNYKKQQQQQEKELKLFDGS